MKATPFLFLCATTLFTGACANAFVSLERRGDRAGLTREVEAEHKLGRISNDEARALAEEVVHSEISKASPADFSSRLNAVYGCSESAESAVRSQMSKEALWLEGANYLMRTGRASKGAYASYLDDAREGYQALATYSLTGSSDGDRRRRSLAHVSLNVRRAAARASLEARDERDIDVLLERSRLEPDPFVRADVLRAALANPSSKVVPALVELGFSRGDEQIRTEVLSAFATTLFPKGGKEEFKRALAGDANESVLMASLLYLRSRASLSKQDPLEADVREMATSLVVDKLNRGTSREKSNALRLVPMTEPFLDGVRAAATKERDLSVRVLAWSKLMDVAQDRDGAKKSLLSVAGNNHGRITGQAELVLAERGDRAIQSWIEKELVEGDKERRLQAVRSLEALGVVARAAPLLLDQDATFRLRAACLIAASSR